MNGEVAFNLFAIFIVCWFIYSLLPERKERKEWAKIKSCPKVGVKGAWGYDERYK